MNTITVKITYVPAFLSLNGTLVSLNNQLLWVNNG